jgi:hypothetical protein
MGDIQKRISKAKDSTYLWHVLYEVNESDIDDLKPLIPKLIDNKSTSIRCEILDIIGRFKLIGFLGLVEKRMRDNEYWVQYRAFITYYKLLGKKSLKLFHNYFESENLYLRLTTMSLYYVETRNKDIFSEIRKIITPRDCKDDYPRLVKDIFEHFPKTNEWPEIIQLYKDILKPTPERIARAKCGLDISDILDEVTQWNYKELIPSVPAIFNNRNWIVRCDILDLIGCYKLTEFLGIVKKGLRDRRIIVRNYALGAYYELLREKALPMIRKFCKEKNMRLRLSGLSLFYIETGDENTFKQIRKIVMRKGSWYHFYVNNIFSDFEYYLYTEKRPGIIKLYEDLLKHVPKSWGIAKELRTRLDKIYVSQKNKQSSLNNN